MYKSYKVKFNNVTISMNIVSPPPPPPPTHTHTASVTKSQVQTAMSWLRTPMMQWKKPSLRQFVHALSALYLLPDSNSWNRSCAGLDQSAMVHLDLVADHIVNISSREGSSCPTVHPAFLITWFRQSGPGWCCHIRQEARSTSCFLWHIFEREILFFLPVMFILLYRELNAVLCPAICISEVLKKAGICGQSIKYIRIQSFFNFKQWTSMDLWEGAQIQSKKKKKRFYFVTHQNGISRAKSHSVTDNRFRTISVGWAARLSSPRGKGSISSLHMANQFCWSLVYSTNLCSWADSLHTCPMLFWMSTKVVYLQHYLVAPWLVLHETAAVLAHIMCAWYNHGPVYSVNLFQATYHM